MVKIFCWLIEDWLISKKNNLLLVDAHLSFDQGQKYVCHDMITTTSFVCKT